MVASPPRSPARAGVRVRRRPRRHTAQRAGIAGALALITSALLATGAQAQAVGLGTADTFAVLAGSTVTNTGPSVVGGNVGVNPGSAIVGFPPGTVVGGTFHANDAVALQAQNDLTTAYNDAAGRASTAAIPADLVGLTLPAGVYSRASSLSLSGTLTLDAQGDPNAVFIFQAGSTLTTASASRVALVNGAQACNVFWQVGSSATLGTDTTFVGSILALTSATVQTRTTVAGRVLARNGQVSLDTNTITRPTCNTASTPTPAPSDQGTGGSDGTGGSSTGGSGSTGGTGGTGRTDSGTGTGSTGIIANAEADPAVPLARTGSPIGTTLLLAAIALTLGAVARRFGRAETVTQR